MLLTMYCLYAECGLMRAVLNISVDVLAGVCCTERERLLMWLTAERWMRLDQTKPK